LVAMEILFYHKTTKPTSEDMGCADS